MARYAHALFHLLPTLIPALCMVLLAIVATGCATPKEQPYGPASHDPALDERHLLVYDGTRLPLKQWVPEQVPSAVIVALHGFNDYAHAFDGFGRYAASEGIAVYAYDQRGFGAAQPVGLWAGEENLRRDASAMIAAARAIHPHVPLYLLGESMGGAVAIDYLEQTDDAPVDGVILVAPAVWGGEHFNGLHELALWLAAHTTPASSLTGEGVVEVRATDNDDVLYQLFHDPLVIKDTRIDAMYGLVALMDGAYHKASSLTVPTLMLYGDHDQIIPSDPVEATVSSFTHPHSYVRYPDGYHMLLRDMQGDIVMQDIVHWITRRDEALPSGYAVHHGFAQSYDITKAENTVD